MENQESIITVRPTWFGILPMLISILEDGGNADCKLFAKSELERMARAADRAAELQQDIDDMTDRL